MQPVASNEDAVLDNNSATFKADMEANVSSSATIPTVASNRPEQLRGKSLA
jgi:hypothetical protein